MITLKVNGRLVAEVTDRDPKNRDLSGLLAMQLHSGLPMKVPFKDIRWKRLGANDQKRMNNNHRKSSMRIALRYGVAAIVATVLISGQYVLAAENVENQRGSAILVDRHVTPETRALFENLQVIAKTGILFGHQHTTCYGVGWKNDVDRSDVKDVTGSFPAVYGWDRGHIGTERQVQLVVDAFERGGVNTVSWHMRNPITGGNYKDHSKNPVQQILPGGTHHDHFKRELDSFARFATSLRDERGRQIPIIFRPWHEHTGGWFWWGTESCTPDEFIALWRFTVTYLRDVREVHNLLWAYSPSQTGVESCDDYETNRFPGYDYVDILGVDSYCDEDTSKMIRLCRIVVQLAEENGKVPALTEFGYRNGVQNCRTNDWYVAHFLEPLRKDPVACRIAWALTWRNGSKDHLWVPPPGHPGVDDFRTFADDPMILLERDLPDMYDGPRSTESR